MALWYKLQNELESSLELYLEVAESTERVLGESHTFSMSAKSNLVGLYCAMDRDEEAVALAARVVATAEATLDSDHWMIGAFRNAYGFALIEVGQFDKAVQVLEPALTILEATYGKDHSTPRTCESNLKRARDALASRKTGESAREQN